MRDNRFQPPAADVTEPEPPPVTDYELARRDQRAIGFVIDAVVVYPLMILLKTLPIMLDAFALLSIKTGFHDIPELLAWPATLLLYYLICEGIWSGTIGKLITGTHVIQVSGERPLFTQIVIRTLIRLIPLEFATYLGRDGRPAGWHDRWSGTRVVSRP